MSASTAGKNKTEKAVRERREDARAGRVSMLCSGQSSRDSDVFSWISRRWDTPSRSLEEARSRLCEYCLFWFLCYFSVSLAVSPGSPSLKISCFSRFLFFFLSVWTKRLLPSSQFFATNICWIPLCQRDSVRSQSPSIFSNISQIQNSSLSPLPASRSSSRYWSALSAPVCLSPFCRFALENTDLLICLFYSAAGCHLQAGPGQAP